MAVCMSVCVGGFWSPVIGGGRVVWGGIEGEISGTETGGHFD